MNIFFYGILALILISLILTLGRAVLGPTTYDRILAANTFGTMVVGLIALCAWLFDDPTFVDIAIIYGLINFVGTVAFLKFFRDGSFNDGDAIHDPSIDIG